MSTPYLGEIKMFAGTFAINGWAFCDGSLLPISQYDALFSLLGTTYGGDGQQTFALPDLRGRAPVHASSSMPQGLVTGTESVTLTQAQLPGHGHTIATAAGGTVANPTGAFLAGTGSGNELYVPTNTAPAALVGSEIGAAGGNQPHDNMMPFTAVTFLIALEGIYPSRA